MKLYKDRFLAALSERYGERELLNMWQIYAEDVVMPKINEEGFEDQFLKDLTALVDSRPLQYVTANADFYGLKFKVDERVLIPRPETEELVYWVNEDLALKKDNLQIVDIGTGSGCIIATLAKLNPLHDYYGIDISKDALALANENADALNVNVQFEAIDFLDENTWRTLGNVDLIVSNPPYIALNESKLMNENVLLHEPHIALFAGDNAVVFYEKIAKFALAHLNPQGCIYLELNEFLKDEIETIFKGHFSKLEFRKDMQGAWRMLKVHL